jgi:hypothetical protein
MSFFSLLVIFFFIEFFFFFSSFWIFDVMLWIFYIFSFFVSLVLRCGTKNHISCSMGVSNFVVLG